MDQLTVMTALHAWLATSSGVEVRPADEEWPAPATGQKPEPWGSYRLGSTQDIAIVPARLRTYQTGQPAGQELRVDIVKPQRLVVTVQFFTPEARPSLTGGPPWAVPLLERALLDLEKQAVRAPLIAAGLGLTRVGAARNISAIAGTRWQGRATADVEFSVVASTTERTGYIEEVGATIIFK